jgi:hypothetical protein
MQENKKPSESDGELAGAELITAAANDKKLSPVEAQDALEWFLSDEDQDFTQELRLNVGSPSKPKWVSWEIKTVDLDTLRRIRRQSQAGSRAQRRGAQAGEIDEVEANLRIVLEGTHKPDLREIAKQKGDVDPAETLKRRFSHKPGLIGQISGEIMSISGYDDEDVREVDAAGN